MEITVCIERNVESGASLSTFLRLSQIPWFKMRRRGNALQESRYTSKGGARVKGIKKCVVEILEPKDESIERVLVIFKPESGPVREGKQRQAAEKYVSGLVSWHASPLPAWLSWRTAGIAGAAAAVLAALWFVF